MMEKLLIKKTSKKSEQKRAELSAAKRSPLKIYGKRTNKIKALVMIEIN